MHCKMALVIDPGTTTPAGVITPASPERIKTEGLRALRLARNRLGP